MVPLIAGVGLGAAGTVANYIGGKKDAKRRGRALDEYGRTSAQIYDDMAKDAWNAGSERQRGTGQVISGLTTTMSTPGTQAPQTADFMPAMPDDQFRSDAYRQVMQQAIQPRAEVDQANIDADQAGLDRVQLGRLLDALGFSGTIESQANAPGHTRTQFTKQRELEEAKRRLEAVLGSTGNSTRNLQLLGSLLNTAGQASMMYGANAGEEPARLANSGGLARDASNASFFNNVAMRG